MDYTNSKFPKPTRGKKTKTKKPKASSIVRKCDALFRRIIIARDKWCVTCGSTDNLEVSHYITRRKYGTRWTLSNSHAQCRACHRAHHDNDPAYLKYIINRYDIKILDSYKILQESWVKDKTPAIKKYEKVYRNLQRHWEEVR